MGGLSAVVDTRTLEFRNDGVITMGARPGIGRVFCRGLPAASNLSMPAIQRSEARLAIAGISTTRNGEAEVSFVMNSSHANVGQTLRFPG